MGSLAKLGPALRGVGGGCVSAMGSIFAATLRIWAVLRGCARQGTWDRGKIVSNLRINPAPCLTYLGTGSRIFSVPVLAQPARHTQGLWCLLFDAAYCCAPYAAIRINVNFGAKKVALALKLARCRRFCICARIYAHLHATNIFQACKRYLILVLCVRCVFA